MTKAIERATQIPGQGLRQPGAWPGHDSRQQRSKVDWPDASARTRWEMVCYRYPHHVPSRVAMEEALDAWARHAAASNGFGDLP